MKIETDSFKCYRLLESRGLSRQQAKAIISTFSETEITNLSTMSEVDKMIGEATQKVLDKFDVLTHRTEDKIAAQTRWIITTMIAIGAILASLHLFH